MQEIYAEAVWKLVQGGTDAKKAVRSLRDKLEGDGRLALLPRIGRALGRIARREAGRTDLVLTVAREKDERVAQKAAKEALAQMGIDAHDIKTLLDDSLVGGWRLEGRGVLVDASHKKMLLDMYNRVTS